ncbi:MAG: pyruvate dehydrogenase (acetyl-transferring) E1 component subunit alpha [Streptosporangiales bacterium]|nr:pyruvate dehydrogenase (acetyl-transferring) E1 component subunit alpha [Streptosporangiales bacterium]
MVTAPTASNRIGTEVALGMLRTMLLIRRFEEAMVDLYQRNLIPGFIHPAIGEEAVHAGVQAHLRGVDHVAATHRGHGPAIAKGLDLQGMMAEVLGRRDGLLGGRGGSLHVGDWTQRCLPASPLVGGNIATMTGVALAHRDSGDGGVAVAYFGDGALNRGSCHEAVNLAAIWRLPVVFAVIDNGWAISVPRSYATAGALPDRARAYGIPGEVVDGKDVLACYEGAGNAVARARDGGGPSMLFFDCPRGYGHEEGDAQEYRDRAEYDAARARDPIPAAIATLRAMGVLTDELLTELRQDVESQVSRAVRFGMESPEPDGAEAFKFVRPSQQQDINPGTKS